MILELVKHYVNIGWKVHELDWTLLEIEFAVL